MGKLRTFGVALMALLLLGVVGAGSASATYDSSAKTTTLNAQLTSNFELTTEFGKLVCSGGMTGTLNGTEVEAGVYTSSSLTMNTAFSPCKVLGFGATINTVGCETRFTPSTKSEGGGTYTHHAVIDIACEAGKKMEFAATNGLCTLKIPGQAEIGVVDIENSVSGGKKMLVTNSTASEVAYETSGVFCPGPAGVGTLTASMTIKGEVSKTAVDLWATP